MPAAATPASEANEYAKKLLALGYLSGSGIKPLAPPGGDRPGMTEGAWNNLGLYYRETVATILPLADRHPWFAAWYADWRQAFAHLDDATPG